jgi:hypothetical protein
LILYVQRRISKLLIPLTFPKLFLGVFGTLFRENFFFLFPFSKFAMVMGRDISVTTPVIQQWFIFMLISDFIIYTQYCSHFRHWFSSCFRLMVYSIFVVFVEQLFCEEWKKNHIFSYAWIFHFFWIEGKYVEDWGAGFLNFFLKLK